MTRGNDPACRPAELPTAVAPATQRTLLIIGPAELLGRPR
ncbi:hypothetical protein MPS_4609 [Mycobacterium pseudoshottsii JCM 15466]|nr:hypothetical protein MPS_4609 [Mycobacterium pseudoshottsii JCM 15466]